MRLVGFELAWGKYLISAALPAAASLPFGAAVAPPNPAGEYRSDPKASAPNTTRPTARVCAVER